MDALPGTSLNTLLDDELVLGTLRQAWRASEPGSLQVLRTHTLHTYRTTFATSRVAESPGRIVCWSGHGSGAARPRATFSATIDVLTRVEGELWRRTTHEHRERHHPRPFVEQALAQAGFALDAVLGDEDFQPRLVYLARRPLG